MKHRLKYVATDKAPYYTENGDPHWWNKRPSIFMPRWAARTWLEILGVRAERIRDISEEDCIAEGVRDVSGGYATANFGLFIDKKTGYKSGEYAKDVFPRLWNSIHGPDAWKRNDWVWAYKFKRREKPEED